MARRDGAPAGLFARLGTALAGLLSFRVAVALSTSMSVTAAVAGPLALQAMRVRDREPRAAVARAAPATTAVPRRPPVTATPSSEASSTSAAPTTSATASSTTATSAEPVVAAGRVERTTTTVRRGTTTTEPSTNGVGLAAGVRDDRTDGVELDGARVTGEVFVFVSLADVRTVRWWLDQSGPAGPPTRTTSTAPFDLGTPFFDTSTLSVGRHRVYAEVVTGSTTLRRVATFDVAR